MSTIWRRAPFALLHHRVVLAAVLAAAGLVALTAASAPLLTSSTASTALKNQLAELSPLGTGLEIKSTLVATSQDQAAMRAVAGRNGAGAVRLASTLGSLGSPIRTLVLGSSENLPVASSSGGFTEVVAMSRTGVLGHIRKLAQVPGAGIWISDVTARALRVRPGGRITFTSSSFLGGNHAISERVKGIYRALAYQPESPYWVNFRSLIYPLTPDLSPPSPFAFATPSELFRLQSLLGGGQLDSITEFPVDPRNVTLPIARRLAAGFAMVNHQLVKGRTRAAQAMGCHGFQDQCAATSSLSAAVTLADDNVAAISPIVSLLSDLGMLLAFSLAAASGAFTVRRRQTEAAFMFSRGERATSFAARTGLESSIPTLVGAACGVAIALGLARVLSPRGTIDPATLSSSVERAGGAAVIALALMAFVALAAFQGLFDTGRRTRRWRRPIPWEVIPLGAGAYLIYDITTGGGLARSASTISEYPTLAVFVAPLLLATGVAGLATRVVRRGLSIMSARFETLPNAVFLAQRRILAARGMLTVIMVVLVVSFTGFFYAEVLSASLSETTAEKGYIGIGSDVEGMIGNLQLPLSKLGYPATTVAYGNGAANVNGDGGEDVDVLTVTPATLEQVLHWSSNWGPSPAPLLRNLSSATALPLPVIVTSSMPSTLHALSIQGLRIPVRVIGRVRAFPGMTTRPLAVVATQSLASASTRLGLPDPLGTPIYYIWLKGPPGAAARLTRPPVDAAFINTIDGFRHNPNIELATRSYLYLRAIAIGAAILALAALALYLQARQRSQTIASALSGRMGLSRRTEIYSLVIELAAVLLFGAVLAGVTTVLVARPITHHVDLLPEYPPGPVFVTPWHVFLGSLVGLLVIAVAAGGLARWSASRANVSEEMRIA